MTTHTVRHAAASAPARLLRALAVLLCALALSGWASAVSAHASLVSSSPAAGAVLPSAPAQASLTFNEPVSPLVLKIVQPDGSMLEPGRIQASSEGLRIALPGLSQHGAYALSWRVVSADGHPVGGTLTFSIGAAGAGPAEAAAAHSGRNFLIWLSRLTWYAGLFFGIGLAAWHAFGPARRGPRRPGSWVLALAGAATVANLGLLGIDALDMPLSGLFGIEPWRAAGATSFALSAALALAALGAAALAWGPIGSREPGRPSRQASARSGRLWAALAIVLLGAALAASGHASAAPPAWLARPAVWLHVVAVVLWIGMLPPLAQALGDAPDLARLERFSALIPAVLLALLASGGVLIFLQFDAPSSLWLTAYGRVLALKLALVAALLGLGAYNRYGLTRAVLRGEAGPRRVMRRIVRLECALAAAILAVAALWRFTPPPRALSAAPAAVHAVSAHVHADAAMADLALSPAAPGRPGTLTLYLSAPDMAPLAAQEVDVAFSNAAAGIEPIVFSAHLAGDGTWRVENLELPHQDHWRVRIDALVSDFDRIRLETTLELAE